MQNCGNEFGWRVRKRGAVFAIERGPVSLRSRLRQLGPAFAGLLLITALWLGREASIRCVVLFAVPGLGVLWFLMKKDRVFEQAFACFGIAALMFLGLLLRQDVTIPMVAGCIPLLLLVGLMGMPLPVVVSMHTRSRVVGGPGGVPHFPFSQVKVVSRFEEQSGLYRVYLQETEPPSGTSAAQCGRWSCLVWESTDETEAATIADHLRTLGLGTPDPYRQKEPVTVKADRGLRLIFFGGHLLAIFAVVGLLAWIAVNLGKSVEGKELLLWGTRLIQMFIGFMFLSLLPYALHLWHIGQSVVRCQHMPPIGVRSLIAMKVRDGESAVAKGRMLKRVAWTIIIVALFGAIVIPYAVTHTFIYGN